MGTIRTHLKCEVCGTVTLLRTQYGWLDQHPIRVPCGNCRILIKGKAVLDQENADFYPSFDNARIVSPEDGQPKFYIEASGELMTEKLQDYDPGSFQHILPPFFKSGLWEMEDPSDRNSMPYRYDRFKGIVMQFIEFSKNEWPRVRRINELWLNKQYNYLVQEVQKVFPKKQFPMNNELEQLRGVHNITRLFFQNIITHKHLDLTLGEFKVLLESDIEHIVSLAKYYVDSYDRYERRILTIFDKFVELFPFLIPAFSLRYYYQIREEVYREKGITTASFEDLKEFYIDAYELSVDLATLVVAFNNIKYRNNYKTMPSDTKYTLESFAEAGKAKKLEYLQKFPEVFNELFEENALDKGIRNAIGHNTYEEDSINQIIKYDPKGKGDSRDIGSIYLVQFAEKCLGVFQTIINLWEFLYQTRKVYYVSMGLRGVGLEVFSKKKLPPQEANRKKNIRKRKKAAKSNKR